jgi:hypothetical protein
MFLDWLCHVVYGGGMNDQLEYRVWVAWILFWNEPPFPMEGLDVELFVGG